MAPPALHTMGSSTLSHTPLETATAQMKLIVHTIKNCAFAKIRDAMFLIEVYHEQLSNIGLYAPRLFPATHTETNINCCWKVIILVWPTLPSSKPIGFPVYKYVMEWLI